MDWLVLPNQIISGNPESPVAVISGWTHRDSVQEELKSKDPDIMDKVAGIGQLYTSSRGIDMLVRNLLARPRISQIVILGEDYSDATKDLYQFFNRNLELEEMHDEVGPYWSLSGTKIRIRNDIPGATLNDLRKRIDIIQFEYKDQVKDAVAAINLLDAERPAEIPDPVNYSPIRITPTTYPHPVNAHVIRAVDVPTAYLEVLHKIMRYGHRIQTHYDQDSLELCNLMIVVTDQDPCPKELPKHIPFNFEHLLEYQTEIMSDEPPPEGISYKYGHHMRAYFGVDQIKKVAWKLARKRISRSAVIGLVDPNWAKKHSPCLNHIWMRILNNRLHMTCTIRSNDMFMGWPENMYGLRFLQWKIRAMILKAEGKFMDDPSLLPLGDLITNSQSAHLYEDTWDMAREIVKTYRRWKPWWDEGGEWVIDRHGETINANHAAPGGSFLELYHGSGDKIRKEIAKNGPITDVSHAIWVGYQLGRMDRE